MRVTVETLLGETVVSVVPGQLPDDQGLVCKVSEVDTRVTTCTHSIRTTRA